MTRAKEYPLEFSTFNGVGHVQLGHGDNCILVSVQFPTHSAGAVLTADVAEQLGRAIVQQARFSRTTAVTPPIKGEPRP